SAVVHSSSTGHDTGRDGVSLPTSDPGSVSNSSSREPSASGVTMSSQTIVLGLILVLVLVASLVANAFVLIVFCKRKSLSLSNRFVANLTICNCLNAFFVMPFALASLLSQRWLFGDAWCICTGFLMSVLVSASILTLAVMSIDRYFAVVTPLHYSMRLTSRRCSLLILSIWAGAILISAPPIFGWNSIGFQVDKMVCTVRWSSRRSLDAYYTFFLVSCSFLVPLVAMLWTYARIFRAARGNSVRARRNSVIRGIGSLSQHSATPLNGRRRSSTVPIIRRLSHSSSRSSSLLWRMEEWKTAVTSFLVLSSFAVCWAPYFVVMSVEAAIGVSDWPLISSVSIVLAMASCAVNPLVYVFRNKVFRKDLRLIVQRRRFWFLGGGGSAGAAKDAICVPQEISGTGSSTGGQAPSSRRTSVVRNESGRSLKSMAELEEREEGGAEEMEAL
ncbi:hypothetical protein EGW08_014530, partial [Elysia chlorotica]